MTPDETQIVAMGDALRVHADAGPDRIAIVCGDASITYAELERRSNGLAHAYVEHGLRPGDIVPIVLPNGIDFYAVVFAVWKAGATPFPVSSRLPAPERQALLDLARPSLVVAADEGDGLGWPTAGPDAPDAATFPTAPPVQPWKAIGSGGSTGRPKLIVAGLPATIDVTLPATSVDPGDVVLVPGPLYHQGPFIFSAAALFGGGRIVVMERFDATSALRLIEQHRVTFVQFVPTMTQRIWRLDPSVRDSFDLSSLRMIFSTGAPWSPWLKEEWIRWLGPDRIVEGYGGTEEHGGLKITGREALQHPGSVGRAHDGVCVLDADGNQVPPGEVGEIHFRAPASGSHRYLGAEIVERDGWRTYGDLGSIGEDGYVYLADRRTDMIVTGGANVYPAEVEAALEAHPAVRSAVVIGLPDGDLGQRVHAIVDATEPTDADALRTHVRTLLAGYKVPRSFELVDEPLRDDAGKVRRSALRDERLG